MSRAECVPQELQEQSQSSTEQEPESQHPESQEHFEHLESPQLQPTRATTENKRIIFFMTTSFR